MLGMTTFIQTISRRWYREALLALAITFISQAAFSLPASLPEHAFRAQFEGSEALPDHIAFLYLMREAYRFDDPRVDTRYVRQVQHQLSMDPREAAQFVNQLQQAYQQLITQNQSVASRLLCKTNVEAFEKNEAYHALDALDDIKDTNLKRQYSALVHGMSIAMATSLGDWLNNIKTDSDYHRLDHAQVFEHTGERIEDVLSEACNQIATY
jgi:hypothetical protein